VPLSDQDNTIETIEATSDALYALPPEEFIPARDDRVTAARRRGDRELAHAISRLRRPTRAAWLANLLARYRAEQIEELLGLAVGLAQAQRTLDGDALRTLATQRHRAVAAMARDAARLAQAAGSPATDAQLRELQGILEAALAQPEVVEEVRAGRLTRTLRYTGFGPEADPGATPTPAQSRFERGQAEGDGPETGNGADPERAERELALADAERDAAAARKQQEADETARCAARERHDGARDRVASLTAELSAARAAEHAAAEASKAAIATARESRRAATAAATQAEQARARLGP